MAEINLGSTPLSDKDHDWFRAMASAYGWTIRTKISEILKDFIHENMEEFVEVVAYSARKHGLTFDEAFHRLRNKEELGDPRPDFPVVAEMEEKLDGLTQK